MGDRGAQLGRPSLPAVGAVPLHGLSRRSARGRVRGQLREARLDRLEAVLAGREWLAGGTFSIADILMADVLRPVDMFDGLANYPASRAYVARAKARPAFVKAYGDQMAHFAAADAPRGQEAK